MIIYEAPIKIEIINSTLFANNIKQQPTVRTLKEMKDVLMNKDTALHPETELYYMYRNVYSNSSLRYDIVFMPQRIVGMEYNKTYGHYHSAAEKGLSYPEVYQVLIGSGIFILQKKNSDESVDVVTVAAKNGDVLLIPPNYGHVSINAGDKALLLANIVSNKCESLYSEYKENHGAAFYYTKDGFVHNTKYKVNRFERKTISEINSKYHFTCSDLLKELYATPEKFKFLEKPSLLEGK
jgi:glucose-6-phosphate isomerase